MLQIKGLIDISGRCRQYIKVRSAVNFIKLQYILFFG